MKNKVKQIENAQLVDTPLSVLDTINLKPVEQVIPKILIGIPVLSWTHESVVSFINFWTSIMTYKEKKRRFHVAYKFIYRKPVHMAEEELAQFAIDCGCTHILLMDDDIYDVTVESLLMLLDADKDVIGGIMHTGGFPYAMCAFRRYNTKNKVIDMPIIKGPARLYEIPPEQRIGIQKVDLIPFAFTLIKTNVFSKIPKPWFECTNQAPTDSWFADKILKAGLSYYAHFGVYLNHKGVTLANKHLYFQLGLLEQQAKQGGNVIGLTPDEMKKHEILMTKKLEDAEAKLKIEAVNKQMFFEKSSKHQIAVPLKKD